MLHKTKGIVLHSIPFRETSVIAKIYTDKFGIQSYLINGVRTNKSKQKASALQQLSMLEMVVYKREHKNLERIAELKPLHIYTSIPFDKDKRLILLFIAELLGKCLKEEEANAELFEFLENNFLALDKMTHPTPDWHLVFMLQLCQYLGFYPQPPGVDTPFFDLQNGSFAHEQPTHLQYLNHDAGALFASFLTNPESLSNRRQRQFVLQVLADYYAIHIPGFGILKSPAVLEELLQ